MSIAEEKPVTVIEVAPSTPDYRVVEWQGGAFGLLQAAQDLQMNGTWVDPRHSKIANLVRSFGFPEFSGGRINFLGGSAKDQHEIEEYIRVYHSMKAQQGILIVPFWLTRQNVDLEEELRSCVIDSSAHGDLLANIWKVFAFGAFDVRRLEASLQRLPPSSFATRYRECGFDILPDTDGFPQIHRIPHCVGHEIHICDHQGNWSFSNDSLYPGMPHKTSLHSAWRWPLIASTGVVPTIGQRLHILGGLSQFRESTLADDSYANDALWRMTPQVIWRQALIVGSQAGQEPDDESNNQDAPPFHMGGGGRRKGAMSTQYYRRSLQWQKRKLQSDIRDFDRIEWINVREPRRFSMELGSNGIVGRSEVRASDRYPGSSALSEHNPIDNEDFTGNFTWPCNDTQRYSTSDLAVFVGNKRWTSTYPAFSYKRIWYAERAFNTGLYGFHFEGYFYEVVRLAHRNLLGFAHLDAPLWFERSIFGLI